MQRLNIAGQAHGVETSWVSTCDRNSVDERFHFLLHDALNSAALIRMLLHPRNETCRRSARGSLGTKRRNLLSRSSKLCGSDLALANEGSSWWHRTSACHWLSAAVKCQPRLDLALHHALKLFAKQNLERTLFLVHCFELTRKAVAICAKRFDRFLQVWPISCGSSSATAAATLKPVLKHALLRIIGVDFFLRSSKCLVALVEPCGQKDHDLTLLEQELLEAANLRLLLLNAIALAGCLGKPKFVLAAHALFCLLNRTAEARVRGDIARDAAAAAGNNLV